MNDDFVIKVKALLANGKKQEAIEAIDEEQRRVRTYAESGQFVPDIKALQFLKVKICAGELGRSLKQFFPIAAQMVRDMKLLSWLSDAVIKPYETKHPISTKVIKLAIVVVGLSWKVVWNQDGARTKLSNVCKYAINTTAATAKLVLENAKQIVSRMPLVKKGMGLLGRAIMAVKDKIFGRRGASGQTIEVPQTIEVMRRG